MNQSKVETLLRDIAAGSNPPADLSVSYDDMHGLWGGMTIMVSGAGNYERRQRDRGSPEQALTILVSAHEIRELVRLLIELKAWKQETLERAAVPDESRATLMIGFSGGQAGIWEWHNDLTKNERLARIRDRMLAFDKASGHCRAPTTQ